MSPTVLREAHLVEAFVRRIRQINFTPRRGNFLGRIPMNCIVIDTKRQVYGPGESITSIATVFTENILELHKQGENYSECTFHCLQKKKKYFF